MSFWGVEVKAGKPYTLTTDEDLGGKLILTQATLGSGSSSKKSILQVNVGEADPVFLCSLLPEKSESCSLNLEFDEDDDVKFSVVGPTSIHISGFIQAPPQCGHEDDSDSYGEDIEGTESDDSVYDSEDGSDDEFIDDDDMNMFPPSRVPNRGVVIEEIEDDEKPAVQSGGKKQAKNKKESAQSEKKAQQQIVVQGNTGVSVLESEDEDGFPVSSSQKGEANVKSTQAKNESKKKKKKNEAKDDGESAIGSKRKVDAMVIDEEAKSDAINGDTSGDMKKKKKKKSKTENDAALPSEDAAIVKQDERKEDKKVSKADKDAKQSKDKPENKPSKPRTYPNGFIIEELAMGKPNGKRANRGKKVSLYYIGKLKKTGKQFDANIGGKPFKFRLGVGQVIKGWDIGVEGMRVGDKRRLTVPPSLGYGAQGYPPQIPPNAWLVFDVELIDVA